VLVSVGLASCAAIVAHPFHSFNVGVIFKNRGGKLGLKLWEENDFDAITGAYNSFVDGDVKAASV